MNFPGIVRFGFLAVIALAFSLAARAEQRVVYLSHGGKLTVFSADSATGKLSPAQEIEGQGIAAIDEAGETLYCVGGDKIRSFRIKADGRLDEFATEDTDGSAGYLDIDATGNYLAGNNYGAGTVTLWRIGGNGAASGSIHARLVLEKRAHSSVFSPDNRFLLVPATGPNKVFQLRFDAEAGTLLPNDPSFASGPTESGTAQQPRHLVFHPNCRVAYTTLERELPGVGVWEWNAEKGSLEVVQDVVTLPEGFEGAITTADLHLTPDAKFLYVSNRDLTDRKATSGDSSLVRFRVDGETGRLTLLGHTPCEHIPRSFAIDEAGQFLYVAGQMASRLGAYRIDPDSGDLERVQQIETGKGPNWVLCLTK